MSDEVYNYILHEFLSALKRNRKKKYIYIYIYNKLKRPKSMMTTAHLLTFLKIYILDVKLLTEEVLSDS